MAHQTMISDMFQQIGKAEHEEALQHEAKQLAMIKEQVGKEHGKRRDQTTYMFLGLKLRGKLLLQYPLQLMEVLCLYKQFLQDQQDVLLKMVQGRHLVWEQGFV
jgi:hypothetical protein